MALPFQAENPSIHRRNDDDLYQQVIACQMLRELVRRSRVNFYVFGTRHRGFTRKKMLEFSGKSR